NYRTSTVHLLHEHIHTTTAQQFDIEVESILFRIESEVDSLRGEYIVYHPGYQLSESQEHDFLQQSIERGAAILERTITNSSRQSLQGKMGLIATCLR